MKTNIIVALGVAAVMGLGLSSCVNTVIRSNKPKDIATEEVATTDFTSIVNRGKFDIIYTQGPRKVIIKADKKLIPYLDITSEGGVLTVSLDDDIMVGGNVTASVEVTAPDVTSFETLGSGDIKIKDVKCDSMNVSAKGSGDISIENLSCNSLTAQAFGSGDILLGKVKYGTCIISTEGSGDISMNGCTGGTLNAVTRGSGDIIADGSATSASFSTFGSGDIAIGTLNCDKILTRSNGSGEVIGNEDTID